MFLYQYVDGLDQEEVERIRSEYSNALSDPNFHFQYVDIKSTHFMGMEIEKPVLITVHPRRPLPMHIDQREGLALNIPLANCEHTITNLWEVDRPHKIGYTTNGIPYFYYSDDTVRKKVGSFKLTKPVLFDVRVPHSVTNYGTKTRLAISLRFKKDPWHLVNGYRPDSQ